MLIASGVVLLLKVCFDPPEAVRLAFELLMTMEQE